MALTAAQATILILIPTCVVAGCSQKGPELVEVRGTVTYHGKPLGIGTINFVPVSSQGAPSRPAVGRIEPDGNYALRAYPDRDGVLAGEYQVAINAYTGSLLENTAVYLVPKRLANPQTSGLKAIVPAHVAEPLGLDFRLVDRSHPT